MRGRTVKRLRAYTNFLKEQDQRVELQDRKFEQFTYKNLNRQIKRLWNKDKVFQKFIQRIIVSGN